MLQWATDALQAASMGPMALPLAFLLGLVSAAASACCTLPAMGMLVAYSGTRREEPWLHDGFLATPTGFEPVFPG